MPRSGLGAVRFGFVRFPQLGLVRSSTGLSGITMDRVICSGPDPEKRPDRMKSEKADPPARMNGILMGMITRLGDVIRDVVNRDHPVGEGQDDKDENDECEVTEKVHGDLVGVPDCCQFAAEWVGPVLDLRPTPRKPSP